MHVQALLVAGVGVHHAAMAPEDRLRVEQLFMAQDLAVLCATSTLAQGVNLPARLVIIKGTRRYCGAEDDAEGVAGYKEYDITTCLQMVGRAGRPQFDTEGVAVIMTLRDVSDAVMHAFMHHACHTAKGITIGDCSVLACASR